VTSRTIRLSLKYLALNHSPQLSEAAHTVRKCIDMLNNIDDVPKDYHNESI